MIQITAKGITGITDNLLAQLAAEFAEKRCVVLPRFISENLLHKMMQSIDASSFSEKQHLTADHQVFATDLSISGKAMALQHVNFLLNNKQLFKAVEIITGCKPIQSFTGRIYRNMPHTQHKLDWHDDLSEQFRLVALSVNLSPARFEGGKFQIRKKGSNQLLREVASGELGDTHLFAVAPNLEHRVTPLEGLNPRTAAAGWFLDTNKSMLSQITTGQNL